MNKRDENEDVCCASRCWEDGEAFCEVCDGWYCLDHLTLLVGTPGTPATYVCGVCLSEWRKDDSTTL